MSQQFGSNPYASPNQPNPQFGPGGAPPGGSNVQGKVMPPAIFLIVCAVLGLLITAFNVVMAMVMDPVIDPNAPEFVQQMQKSQTGPLAVAIQSAFFLLNIVILVGAIMMLKMKSWPFALTASILAMVNIGGCCCILGLPAGIWSLIILLQEDVKRAFR